MFISESNLAAILGTSLATVQTWSKKGVYPSFVNEQGIKGFEMEQLQGIPEIAEMVNNHWQEEMEVRPTRTYNSIELFAGGGGLALGLSKAGFHHVLLNEFDVSACKTLRRNRPAWNVIEGDVCDIDFSPLRGKVDFLSGGFPCQAFSYAGKQGGFNDTRGTLFFELARAVKEIRPKVFMGENVKGLTSHDDGRTFETICNTIRELGYTLVEPRVLRAIMYQVPQKRERLILIAIRNDIAKKVQFRWPSPFERVMNLRDALFKSVIYDTDVPPSEGVVYPEKKRKVLELVPMGGDWRNLPEEVAKSYMGGSWLLGGGKTGMARRLSLDEPSLTLTCSPCQKQTERCHPLETRPLSVREYARIQTFPDDWSFEGSMGDKYKQIGNAVPVNLAWAVGRSLIRLLNDLQALAPEEAEDCTEAVIEVKANLLKKREKESGQLNLFDALQLFPDNILNNTFLAEPLARYGEKGMSMLGDRRVLVALVKEDNEEQFLKKSAKIYYTGKAFPSTVSLNKLFYFAPYIKGRGVRDLYYIKTARIGSRKEGSVQEDADDLRLVFELKFVKQLYDDYKPMRLTKWHTFRDTAISKLEDA